LLVFVIRRLVWAAALVAVITLITFQIFLVIPSSRVSTAQGQLQPGLRTQWNLDHHSLPGQYVRFLDRVFIHGDLGTSLHQTLAVREILSKALPVTLSLLVGGTILWVLLAFPIGLLSAMRPRSLLDKGLMIFVLAGVSAHPVWLGLILSYFFGFKWHLLPIAGYCDLRYNPSHLCGGPRYWAFHMILPWITFALLFTALYARMIRAGVLEALGEDYVRTARAKGAGTWRILRRHVLRNALLPVVSMLGMDVGLAFGGAIFIETVFDLPGIGQTVYQALGTNDQPVIMGVALVVGVAVAITNLVADLVYCLVDPRVRLCSSGWARRPSVRWRRSRAQPKATVSSPG
jgi:peptide/nickel transport system permease protein